MRGASIIEDIVLPDGHLKGGRLHHHDDIPLELHIAVPIENRAVGTATVRCVGTLNVASEELLFSFQVPKGTPDSLDFGNPDRYKFLPT